MMISTSSGFIINKRIRSEKDQLSIDDENKLFDSVFAKGTTAAGFNEENELLNLEPVFTKDTTTPEYIISKISAEEVDIYTDLIDEILNSLTKKQEDTVDDTLATFCQTPECVQQLKDYMKFRQENGYPTAGGRWG